MDDLDDITLLQEFARNDSHVAFETIVARYTDMVYSAALRQVRNPDTAQEVTQAVFIILAQKASRITPETILPAWLFTTTRYTALAEIRQSIRRQKHEGELQMESDIHQPEADPLWEQISPMLDEAMAKLGEKDRQAVILRFFENRSLADVGAFLGANENTAGRRVTRALEKLKRFFAKRGVVSTGVVIAGVISANSVHAAPAGLTSTISATTAQGAAVAASTMGLAQGGIQLMKWIKMKLAIGVTSTALLVGAVATVAVTNATDDSKLLPQQIAKKSQAAYAALSSYADSGKVITEGYGITNTTSFTIKLQRPNQYRINWSQTAGSAFASGTVWSDGTGNFMQMNVGDQQAKVQKMKDMQTTFASATGVSSQAASTVPAAFFNPNWGDVLRIAASSSADVSRGADEKIGDVECFVITSVIDPSKLPDRAKIPADMKLATTTMKTWVGKKDYLIHQTQTAADQNITIPSKTDEALRKTLERQNKTATPEAVAALRKQMEGVTKILESMKPGKITFTQTHSNIVINQTFAPADFLSNQ